MTAGNEALGDHIDRLYRAAWCLCGDPEDAEALVQETFELVLRRRRRVDGENDLGLLLTAMRHAFIGSRRVALRHSPPPPGAHPGGTVALYEEVSQLPAKLRDAVIAADVVGLSPPQAAKSLGIRQASLVSRLQRGRSQLAQTAALQ